MLLEGLTPVPVPQLPSQHQFNSNKGADLFSMVFRTEFGDKSGWYHSHIQSGLLNIKQIRYCRWGGLQGLEVLISGSLGRVDSRREQG